MAILKELGISRNENTKCTKIYKRYDFVDQESILKYIKNNVHAALEEAN